MNNEVEDSIEVKRIVTLKIKRNQFDYDDVRYDRPGKGTPHKPIRPWHKQFGNISIKDINRYVLMAFSDDGDYVNRDNYAILEEDSQCCFFLYDKLDDGQGTKINFQFEDKEIEAQFKNGNYDFNLVTQQVYKAINTAKYYLNLVNSGDSKEKPYEATLNISGEERKIARAYLDFRSFSKEKLQLSMLLFLANLFLFPFSSSLILLLARGVLLAILSKTIFTNFRNYHIYSYDFLKKLKDFIAEIFQRKEKIHQTLEVKGNVCSLEDKNETEERSNEEEIDLEANFKCKDAVFVEINRLISKVQSAQNIGLDCSNFAKMLNDILDEYDSKKGALKDDFGHYEYLIAFQSEAFKNLGDFEHYFDFECQKYEKDKIYLQELKDIRDKISDLENNHYQNVEEEFLGVVKGKNRSLQRKINYNTDSNSSDGLK